MNNILACNAIYKSWHDGDIPVKVLSGIDFTIGAGECMAIVGPSGSGKSTFLHLLGGLDFPSAGTVRINDVSWQDMNERQRCEMRSRNLGFIYQFHHLLPEFNAIENVMMPLLLADRSNDEAETLAHEILVSVGLGERIGHKPAQLSGGERQRVAIARALVHRPQCVLADEPTGNLDNHTALRVFDMMLALNRKFNTALVIVTHDLELAAKMDKIIYLQDGLLCDA